MRALTSFSGNRLISAPSTSTLPPARSSSLNRAINSVVLPLPVRPTMPTWRKWGGGFVCARAFLCVGVVCVCLMCVCVCACARMCVRVCVFNVCVRICVHVCVYAVDASGAERAKW